MKRPAVQEREETVVRERTEAQEQGLVEAILAQKRLDEEEDSRRQAQRMLDLRNALRNRLTDAQMALLNPTITPYGAVVVYRGAEFRIAMQDPTQALDALPDTDLWLITWTERGVTAQHDRQTSPFPGDQLWIQLLRTLEHGSR